jgi:hypothetical protein
VQKIQVGTTASPAPASLPQGDSGGTLAATPAAPPPPRVPRCRRHMSPGKGPRGGRQRRAAALASILAVRAQRFGAAPCPDVSLACAAALRRAAVGGGSSRWSCSCRMGRRRASLCGAGGGSRRWFLAGLLWSAVALVGRGVRDRIRLDPAWIRWVTSLGLSLLCALGWDVLCFVLGGAGTPRCRAGRRCAGRLRWSPPSPSIGLRRLLGPASPWPADGSHGKWLSPHVGCSRGRFGRTPTPLSCCQLRWTLVRRVGMLHDLVWQSWMQLPPTRESCGLVGGRLSPFSGVLPARIHVGWVASGVGGRVACGGALWCVSGTVRPSSKPVARRCCGVVSLRVTFRPHPRCRWCRGVVLSRLCSSVRLRRWHSALVWARLTGAVEYSGDALFSSGLVSEALSGSPPSFLSIFVCWCVFFVSALLQFPPVIPVHLNPSCKKAA